MYTGYTLLTHYAIDTVQDSHLIKAGQENTNMLIVTTDNRYVLRLYNRHHSARGERTPAQIRRELALMTKARSAGLTVPQVIMTRDGDPFVTVTLDDEQRFGALFTFMDGTSPDKHSPQTAHDTGQVVNRLYPVSASFAAPDTAMYHDILTRSAAAYDALLASEIAIPEQIIRLKNNLDTQATHINRGDLSRGLIHCDLKLANLLFDDDDCLSAVLDFDDFRYSYLLEECVMALMHELHNKEGNLLRSGHYSTFIAQLSQPQLQAELTHLPYFLGIRLLQDVADYLLNGLDTLVDELLRDAEIRRYTLLN